MDERITARLEEQLRDSHAANFELRERLAEAARAQASANARVAEANAAIAQVEKAHARQKAAEENAAVAQRGREKAERELSRARAELEELWERLEIVKADSDAFAELNDRVHSAKHINDLLGG